MKKTSKGARLLSLVLSLVMVMSLFSAAGITASGETLESGSCGDSASYVLDSDGTMTFSGSGAITKEFYMGVWANAYKVKKIVFDTNSAISSIPRDFFNCYTGGPCLLREVEINTTVPLKISRNAFFVCTEQTAEPINITITAPSISELGNDFIYSYDCPFNVVFNVEEPCKFKKMTFRGVPAGSTVTYPEGSVYYSPAGYSFNDNMLQDEYDYEVAKYGSDEMFWRHHSGLVEGTDYVAVSESSAAITAENVSDVFGSLMVKNLGEIEAVKITPDDNSQTVGPVYSVQNVVKCEIDSGIIYQYSAWRNESVTAVPMTVTALPGYSITRIGVEYTVYITSDPFTVYLASDGIYADADKTKKLSSAGYVGFLNAFVKHAHTMSYSADGATLTAECTGTGCDLKDNKVSLTIKAPAKKVYNDNGSPNATIATDDLAAFNAATGLSISASDITYEGVNVDYTGTTAPTDAGTYKAKITAESKTASVEYTIEKANAAYTVPTDLTAQCGTKLSDIALTTGFAWDNGDAVVLDIGSNTFKASFTPDDAANFNGASDIDINVTGTAIHHEAVEAKCETDGNIEYYEDGRGNTYSDANGTNSVDKITVDRKGHAWQLAENGWTWNGYESATAHFVCGNDSTHMHDPEATVTSEVTTPAGCETDGVRTYTATVDVEGTKYTDTKTEIIEKTGHKYSDLFKWVWEGFEKAVAYIRCVFDKDHVVTKEVTAEVTENVPATCESDGYIYHTATIDIADPDTGVTTMYTETKVETIDQLGHDWSKPEYKWADDPASGCRAERICLREDGANIEKELSEGDNLTYEVVTEPTCGENGVGKYTAKFDNEAFETQTATVDIPALGHDWGEPEYKWADDPANGCMVIRLCCREGCGEFEREFGEGDKLTYEVVTEAACETNGVGKYTAKFDNEAFETQTATADIPALGHDWGEPEYKWADDPASGCMVIRLCCREGCGEFEREFGEGDKLTYEVVTEATCETNGVGKYTAKFDNEAFEAQTATADIPALGHDWEHKDWNWVFSDDDGNQLDMPTAYAIFICRNNKEDEHWETAEVTKSETDTTVTYTAVAEFEGKTYTDTYDVPKDSPDVPDDKNEYVITNRGELVWNKGDGALVVNVKRTDGKSAADKIKGITVNGLPLPPTYYIVTETEDGIDITFPPEVFGQLPSGEYTLKVNFSDGTAERKVTIVNEAEPPAQGLLGDVNGDGNVNSEDALMILRRSAELDEFNALQDFLGDVNSDGETNSSDALEVLRYSVGFPVEYPIGEAVDLPA